MNELSSYQFESMAYFLVLFLFFCNLNELLKTIAKAQFHISNKT